MKSAPPLLALLLAGAAISPALAQPAPQPAEPPVAAEPEAAQPEAAQPAPEDEFLDDEEATEVEGVVVTGGPRRGSVLGDIPPEVELNAREVRALGVGSISELLEVLAPQIQSTRGRGGGQPVTLLNGRRISGFSEIRGIPPEAIQRVEILPEEVALRYGYRADQRVVNIVLRQRFRSQSVEAAVGTPTAGGRADTNLEAGALRINRDGRTSVDVQRRSSTWLLESERDLERSRSSGLFDVVGNVRGTGAGGEIDPALSALAGQSVTIAGAPAAAATGSVGLAQFAPGAGEANTTDVRPFRTLAPATEQWSLNGTVNRTVFGDVGATVNARLDRSNSRSLIGLPSATLTLPADSPFSPFGSDVLVYRYPAGAAPLLRETESDTQHLGMVLDGYRGAWRWSVTGNLDRTQSETLTDAGLDPSVLQQRLNAGDPALNPFGAFPADALLLRGRDRALSTTQAATMDAVVNGRLRELPAGPLSTTFRGTLEARSLESETRRTGLSQEADLSRERGAFQVNVDVPIASRRREVLTGLGNLTLNGNAEVEQLSDFGTLRTLGAGVNWSPTEKLSLLASVTDEDGAPSMQQLGDPVVFTPNVPVFDFTRGETVDVIRVDGGHAGLLADNRRVFKLGGNLKPFTERDLSLSVNYTRSRIVDPIASFPAVTAEIEAAFPERFERDETGRLVRVDARPVNFARIDREEVRWGLNYSRPWGRPTTPAAGFENLRRQREGGGPQVGGERPRGAEGGRRGGGGGFRGGGGGFGGGGQGRLQFSLYHTIRLQDSILIRAGLPELDLLEGAAVGSRGGQPRHELDAQANIARNGLGAFVNARWQAGTTVRGGTGGTGANTLEFSDIATVNLRLFADLGQRREWVQDHPWLRGARVTLAVNNLFDARQDVRDELGQTPVGYQPDYLDPIGRTVRVSFRKLFIPRRFFGGQGAQGGGRRGGPGANPAGTTPPEPRPAPGG